MTQTPSKAEQIRALVEPVIEREGFELVDVDWTSEQGRRILRLYVDTIPPGTKERGITVEHCSEVSRVVSDLFDIEDIFDGPYNLEVSSPGLYRPLTKPEHFDRVVGQRIRLKTYEKLDGRKIFLGTLTQRADESVTLNVDGTDVTIGLVLIAKANLEPLL